MKRFFMFLCSIFVCTIAFADTMNLHWLNEDGTMYETSTCQTGDDIFLPATPPSKRGHTFIGWDAYRRIEYIESTGTQFIDTGVIADQDTSIEVTFSLDQSPLNAGINVVFGVDSGWLNNSIGLTHDRHFFRNNETIDNITSKVYADNTKYKVELRGLQVFINGTFYKSFTNSSNFRCYRSIRLFNFMRSTQSGVNRWGYLKLYNFKVYKTSDGTILRDMIPIVDPNGVPCMYDKANRVFYYNQGTGQFIAGPSINE